MLPESSRAGAKVVELTKFTPRQLRAMHRQQKAAGAAQPAGK